MENPKNKIIIASVISLLAMAGGIFAFKNAQPREQNAQGTNTIAPTLQTEFKIVAFGDSLTAGLGVDLIDSYPSILEDMVQINPDFKKYNRRFTVINMGVSGETSSGALDRVDFALDQKPDIIIMGLGANDMLRSTDPALVLKNLDAMTQKIVLRKVPLVLLGMQSVSSNGKDYSASFNSIYPTVAKKYNLPLVPFFLQGVALEQDLNTNDGIHPNRAGYEKILSENILPILNPFLMGLLKK